MNNSMRFLLFIGLLIFVWVGVDNQNGWPKHTFTWWLIIGYGVLSILVCGFEPFRLWLNKVALRRLLVKGKIF